MSEENVFDDGAPIVAVPVQQPALAETAKAPKRRGGWPKGQPRGKKKVTAKKVTAKKVTTKPAETTIAPVIGIKQLHSDAMLPERSTPGSACYDLRGYLTAGEVVMGYDNTNRPVKRTVKTRGAGKWADGTTFEGGTSVLLYPGDRLLIPTGLIFDIPEGWSMRVHPRSGQPLKRGFNLANQEGIVDWDYTKETYVILHSISERAMPIFHGERIAQVEFVPVHSVVLNVVDDVLQKTSRDGGFTSTGNK